MQCNKTNSVIKPIVKNYIIANLQWMLAKVVTSVIFLYLLTITYLYAQSSPSTLDNLSVKTSTQVLAEAQLNRASSPELTISLARKALIKAQSNNEMFISAQAHDLLGSVNWELNNKNDAEFHFSNAIELYVKLADYERLVAASIELIGLLIQHKRYTDALAHAKKILPTALKHNNPILTAELLTSAGDAYYKSSRYHSAEDKYQQTLQYLSASDTTAKRLRGQTYKRIAQTHKRLKEWSVAAIFYRKSITVYTELNDKRNMARTLNNLAEAERQLGNLVLALDSSIQALKIHQEIDDPNGRAKANGGIGIIYRHIGRYELSLKHMHQSHLYFKQINDIKGIAKTSNQIGLLYTRLKQFNQARSFFELTIDLPESELDADTLAIASREIAVINLNEKKYDKAMFFAQKAKNLYQIERSKPRESHTTRIIGNIYSAMEQYDSAKKAYRESIKLAVDVDHEEYQMKSLIELAEMFIGNDNAEAIDLAKQATSLARKINSNSHLLSAQQVLRKAEKEEGEYFNALYHAEQEIALSKIIQKEKEDNELINAKAILHSHKIESELQALQEETKLNRLELDKKNNEIAIATQARIISELESTKNRSNSIALALLLLVCVIIAVIIYRRFIASHKRNKELDYLTKKDSLTHCYNRRFLFEKLAEDFKSLDANKQYCVIMADIDHFKRVNDTYGHSAGDSVICGVADILHNCVEEDDIISRYGGEEFFIVLPEKTLEYASSVAERMRKEIESTMFEDVSVSSSFGISSITFDAKTPKALIEQADAALYKSKSLGRNRVTVWSKDLNRS